MTTFSRNFTALMAPGLKAVYFDRYKDYPKQFETFFNMEKSTNQFEVTQGVTGFPIVPQMPEGKGVIYEDPIQGFTTTFSFTRFGMGFRVTYEAQINDRYKILGPKMSRMMGKSAAVTREIIAASVFNNGFTDTGPDGVSLFNVAHPLEGGGVWGNAPSVPAALSQTSLQNAITTMRKTPDGRNMLIQIRPRYLIVDPSMEFYALELIKSALKPDSANNNINAIQNRLDVVSWDWLTGTGAWFLAADKEDHSIRWYDRDKMNFSSADDFETDDSKFKVTWMSGVGYDDARGVYGSTGS